jgi:hypothetical protein
MIICLDIEGTLISNAMSQIPRPGLYKFLEELNQITDEVVIYTTLTELKLRVILDILREEEAIPEWFAFAYRVPWSGKKKHLSYAAHKGAVEKRAIYLVDDYQGYIADEDREHWIPIRQFEQPFAEEDHELDRVLEVVRSIHQRELDYQDKWRELKMRVNASFDLPDQTVNALITICLDDGGKLSAGMREVFQGRVPEEIFDVVEKECEGWSDEK